MSENILFLTLFIVFILGVLMLDLLVIGRKSHEVTTREAAIWTGIWILFALGFALFLRFFGEHIHGIRTSEDLNLVLNKYYPFLSKDHDNYASSLELFRKNIATNYLSGYLIEKSLSVDNLFVIMAILKGFSVKKTAFKQVLFWGILGAILMRFIFIFAGAALIIRFEWLLYFFGAYLIYVGVKMYLGRNKEIRIEPQNHPMVKFVSRRFNVFPRYVGNRFFVRKDAGLFITPLFIVLILVEVSDLIFALDSIPAVFAVTRDPYIVFFSNIFAILGLRSLFFLLIKVVERFYLLKIGVSLLLVFVGVKLVAHDWMLHIGYRPVFSLYIILGILTLSIALSMLFPKKVTKDGESSLN
jgi:tellurite resistance protein TerC